MSLEQQMKSGLLYREYGHKDEKDWGKCGYHAGCYDRQ